MTTPSPEAMRGSAIIAEQQRQLAEQARKIASDNAAAEASRKRNLRRTIGFVSGVAGEARQGTRRLLSGLRYLGPRQRPRPTLAGATGAAVEDGAEAKGAIVEGAEAAL
jgi:hypothetical protein